MELQRYVGIGKYERHCGDVQYEMGVTSVVKHTYRAPIHRMPLECFWKAVDNSWSDVHETCVIIHDSSMRTDRID